MSQYIALETYKIHSLLWFTEDNTRSFTEQEQKNANNKTKSNIMT